MPLICAETMPFMHGAPTSTVAWVRFRLDTADRAGLGDESPRSEPELVKFSDVGVVVATVVAGPDCSLFLSRSGIPYACGNNDANKVGVQISWWLINSFPAWFELHWCCV